MSAHTPGPWTVHEFVEIAFSKDGDRAQAGIYEIEEANEQALDLIGEGAFTEALNMATANKRLIAASPDLLAVAVALTTFVKPLWQCPLCLGGEWMHKESCVVMAAREVIAKARGR